MQHIIEEIRTAITKGKPFTNEFVPALLKGPVLWKEDFPISIIHEKSRMKNPADIAYFSQQGLFDQTDHTPNTYTLEQLKTLQENTPQCLQQIQLLALKEKSPDLIEFKPKRMTDKWKKITDISYMQASFDYHLFDENTDKCQVEFQLRELIRKRKEVHALKELGFIYMAVHKQDMSEVFEHYFKENWVQHEKHYYIAWSETLKEINMRYFVCPPE